MVTESPPRHCGVPREALASADPCTPPPPPQVQGNDALKRGLQLRKKFYLRQAQELYSQGLAVHCGEAALDAVLFANRAQARPAAAQPACRREASLSQPICLLQRAPGQCPAPCGLCSKPAWDAWTLCTWREWRGAHESWVHSQVELQLGNDRNALTDSVAALRLDSSQVKVGPARCGVRLRLCGCLGRQGCTVLCDVIGEPTKQSAKCLDSRSRHG